MITVIQTCKNKDEYFQFGLEKLPGITEVLRPYGKNPSLQRNQALLKAKSDIILFLDDDSVIDILSIKKYLKAFENPKVDILGGPAIIRHKDDRSQLMASILSSYFLIGPSACRYSSKGKKRISSEKELILCNLAMRKSALQRSGGFNSQLYPWEENELLIKMNKMGFIAHYDPSITTTRGMSSSVTSFFLKIFNYALNRGKMGGVKSILYALPCLIFISSLYALMSFHLNYLFAFYIVYLCLFGLITANNTKKLKFTFLVPFVTWGLHMVYGMGIILGVFLFFIRKSFGHFLNSSNRVDVLK